MHAMVPAAAEVAPRQTVQPAAAAGGLAWRRCAKNMHDPNGLLDTHLASPRAPASIAAVSLKGILSEASLALSQRVVVPTHSKSVWDTTQSRKILCVVHLNFRKSLRLLLNKHF